MVARRRRPGRGRDAWRIRWYVTAGMVPYDVELALRHRGVTVWAQRGDRDPGGARVASVNISANQKRWAEEILFVQMGLTPAHPERDLDRRTVLRMGARSPYTMASKWSSRPRRAVGLLGRLIDVVAVVGNGYNRMVDPGGVQARRRK